MFIDANIVKSMLWFISSVPTYTARKELARRVQRLKSISIIFNSQQTKVTHIFRYLFQIIYNALTAILL
jgi:hypothetical protein